MLRDLKAFNTTGSGLQLSWLVKAPAADARFLWVQLILPKRAQIVTRGLLAAAGVGAVREEWRVLLRGDGDSAPEGALLLYNHAQAAWSGQLPPFDKTHVVEIHRVPSEASLLERR